MNYRLLTRLALLVLVVGLGLWLWQAQESGPEPQTLSSQSTTDLQQLDILPRAGEALHFQRRGEVWYLQSPYSLAASPERLQAILKLPYLRSHQSFPDTDLDLPALGLEPPRVRLQLGAQVYDFGDSNPLSGQRYVRHAGRVHLLTDTLYHQLNTPAAAMLDAHPIPPGKHLTRIVLSRLVLRRHLDGHWTAEPEHPELDPQRLPDFIHHWQTLQARAVTRYSGPLDGTALEFHFDDGTDMRLQLQTRDNSSWLIRETPRLAYRLPDNIPSEGLLSPFSSPTGTRSK